MPTLCERGAASESGHGWAEGDRCNWGKSWKVAHRGPAPIIEAPPAGPGAAPRSPRGTPNVH
eukprot:4248520-Pyramimonas_sp.AAC.1